MVIIYVDFFSLSIDVPYCYFLTYSVRFLVVFVGRCFSWWMDHLTHEHVETL